jgi:uncharacterized repeat protein (TIGR03803 family)
MLSLGFGRYVLGAIAAVALLAGCGASQPPIGAPGSIQQATSVRAMAAPSPAAFNAYLVFHPFTGSPDGAEPRSGVVAITKRQCGAPCLQHFLVGTTLMGGDSGNDGTVYGLTTGKKGSVTESVLYTFKGVDYSDGSEPTAIFRKYIDAASPVFVTTVAGGTYGVGTLTELTPTSSGPWTESFIYSFGAPPDGESPNGAVTADKAGNLYGTTTAGGTDGAGTVYRMQPKGSSYSESVVYSFKGGTDGDRPSSAVVMDAKGALYGTTVGGGSTGSGTVFKLTPAGSSYKESILYSFQGPPNDGSEPFASCTPEQDKHIFCNGVTQGGGSQNLGTVYQLVPAGSGFKEKVIWNFGSASADGAYPYGGVCVTKKGVIYGTTVAGGSGGSSGLGTFFTLTPSGSTYKEGVYSFTGKNGATPYAGPSVDSEGTMYLTTAAGGKNGLGVVGRIKGIAAGSKC